MQTVFIVTNNSYHHPIVFTSFLAVRTWAERKNFTIDVNSNTILDENNNPNYTIIRTIAFTNKEVNCGLAG